MKHTFFKSLLFGGCLAFVSACNITELDINTDPNRPAAADVEAVAAHR